MSIELGQAAFPLMIPNSRNREFIGPILFFLTRRFRVLNCGNLLRIQVVTVKRGIYFSFVPPLSRFLMILA